MKGLGKDPFKSSWEVDNTSSWIKLLDLSLSLSTSGKEFVLQILAGEQKDHVIDDFSLVSITIVSLRKAFPN